MTPAKSKGLQPTSVTQIIWALAGACSSAPTLSELASLARTVVRDEQEGRAWNGAGTCPPIARVETPCAWNKKTVFMPWGKIT